MVLTDSFCPVACRSGHCHQKHLSEATAIANVLWSPWRGIQLQDNTRFGQFFMCSMLSLIVILSYCMLYVVQRTKEYQDNCTWKTNKKLEIYFTCCRDAHTISIRPTRSDRTFCRYAHTWKTNSHSSVVINAAIYRWSVGMNICIKCLPGLCYYR